MQQYITVAIQPCSNAPTGRRQSGLTEEGFVVVSATADRGIGAPTPIAGSQLTWEDRSSTHSRCSVTLHDLMAREPLDLDSIDAFLQAFDRAHGTADPSGASGQGEVWEAGLGAGGPAPPRWRAKPDDASAPEGWGVADPSPVQRRRKLRIARRLQWGLRPGDLPDLQVLPGYVLDHRHNWRYAASGRRVPGARHRTLDRLWDFGRYEPVLVPCRLADQQPELAWCAQVGDLCDLAVAGRSVSAWRVDAEDWDDRAQYSLGMDAPELAADRLVTVTDVARLLGVAPSTVTSYLARGRLPPPQFSVAGRPVWAAPALFLSLAVS